MKRIASVCASIEGSGLFETPRVVREAWVREYTLETFYGFVCTGNAFIKKSPQEKERAFQEIQALAKKHGALSAALICASAISRRRKRKKASGRLARRFLKDSMNAYLSFIFAKHSLQ